MNRLRDFDWHKVGGISLPYKTHNAYIMAAIAVIGGALFGFDISSMSSFIQQQSYKDFFGSGGKVTPIRQAGITSSMPGGSFLACLVSGWVCDKIGRRNIIQVASMIWIIGSAIQCSSQNIVQLIFGRLISGWAIGFASSQVPVYISEMSPKKIRGTLGAMFQWAVTWGIMIMFFIGYGCKYIKTTPTAPWRTAWGIQMIPGMFLFIGTMFLPESPRWLATKGRWEEAIQLIADIQAKGDRESDVVKIEVEEIKEAVMIEQNSNFGVLDLFKGRVNQRRTIVGLSCQMWQQLTGMNVMMYYIVDIFKMIGSSFGSSDSTNLVASSIQYILNVVMTIPALLFIDRWGRRRVMYYGSTIMMGWLFAMVGILAVYSVPIPGGFEGNPQVQIHIPEGNKSASKAAIAVSYLFVCTFAPTWGPVGWLYASEIWPMEQRATGSAVAAAVNWIFNFAIGMFTPSAFEHITYKTYVIFACCCFAMTIHVFLTFPETHGFTLEEIGQLWEENIPAWKTTNWKPKNVPNVGDINAVGGGHAPDFVPKGATSHIENGSSEEDAIQKTSSGASRDSISEFSVHAETKV